MALPSGYDLFDEVPSVDEYRRLREVAGLSPKSDAAAATALPNSWAAALVRTADGTAVGMGRVIGDGGCFFQVVDIAVRPSTSGAASAGRSSRGCSSGSTPTHPTARTSRSSPTRPAASSTDDHGFRESAPDQLGMAIVLGPAR